MMGSHGTTHGSAAGGSSPEMYDARVVLVGRTGLDAKLRLDPDLELIRTRSPLDAIGELANPVGGHARRTVVIVGADADIGGRSGSPEEFVAAVGRIVPGAVVLGAGDANQPVSAAYQGVVEPTVSTDRLRILIHGDDQSIPAPIESGTPIFSASPKQPETQTPTTEPEDFGEMPVADPLGFDDSTDESADESVDEEVAESAPIPETFDEPMQPEPAKSEPEPVPQPVESVRQVAFEEQVAEMAMPTCGAGDGSLVAALLGGRPIVEAAMDILRARVGRADVEFVAESNSAESGEAGALAVEFDGKRFGWLRSTNDPETLRPRSDPRAGGLGQLQEHARWLAGWLSLADQQRRLRAEAMTDRVSGAWNRRYFDRFLEAAIEQARSQRRMLTVLVFDLDNFKQFNDEMGHEAGDVILRETVNLMHSLTRPTDRICRIGGDEFAVIFYEPEGPRDDNSNHPKNFEAVAERFQRAVLEQRFPRLGIDAPGRLTISGGLATFPWDGNTPEELLRKADQLAMESKRTGKNSITFGSRNSD
ncbi:MAG: diguanylate cyclase domain-containing protein [Phycisphaerales bacterium JB061]